MTHHDTSRHRSSSLRGEAVTVTWPWISRASPSVAAAAQLRGAMAMQVKRMANKITKQLGTLRMRCACVAHGAGLDGEFLGVGGFLVDSWGQMMRAVDHVVGIWIGLMLMLANDGLWVV